MDMMKLAKEIVGGRRLKKDEETGYFLNCDLESLGRGADYIREQICKEKVDLCTIINGRSGRCSEDCKYCAQSAHYKTECETYDFLEEDVILKEAKSNQEELVDRFSIVTSGKALSGEEFEKALSAYRKMKEELRIELCASHGFLTKDQFVALKEAGVSSYHDNIETSRNFFPQICTTHTFDDKIKTIQSAKEAGLSVCSGGIIGMGESWQDRIDMAFTLQELEIYSIPINVLVAIEGTPMEGRKPLCREDILRTIAIFRYINPEANIRLAGGRILLPEAGKEAFLYGASATITGNLLTTSGNTIKKDREMLKEMGRDIQPVWY
ncbi:MAG TPA: biotin synthase BioB [Lachnospiraceae bacterium]